ncbi:DinB family protein [Mucilaginibacter lacusdianchii]|uniref:DinB family protein n=1 Tax=Mucilaginibacter lacusdianchii TaxID=2684211 RepID=UPI00131D5DDB|nr:DinB family protein [Mucilaginibacter sp. JXJ CY 39]
MFTEVISQWQATSERLQEVLNRYSASQLNTNPFTGSWTAAQVGEHLLKSQEIIPLIFKGPVMPVQRSPDEKRHMLAQVFLDFNAKYEAAKTIVPGNAPLLKDDLQCKLAHVKIAIANAAQSFDLTEVCLGQEVPVFGMLTRLEWMYLAIYHTQRHIYQIEKNYEIVIALSLATR